MDGSYDDDSQSEIVVYQDRASYSSDSNELIESRESTASRITKSSSTKSLEELKGEVDSIHNKTLELSRSSSINVESFLRKHLPNSSPVRSLASSTQSTDTAILLRQYIKKHENTGSKRGTEDRVTPKDSKNDILSLSDLSRNLSTTETSTHQPSIDLSSIRPQSTTMTSIGSTVFLLNQKPQQKPSQKMQHRVFEKMNYLNDSTTFLEDSKMSISTTDMTDTMASIDSDASTFIPEKDDTSIILKMHQAQKQKKRQIQNLYMEIAKGMQHPAVKNGKSRVPIKYSDSEDIREEIRDRVKASKYSTSKFATDDASTSLSETSAQTSFILQEKRPKYSKPSIVEQKHSKRPATSKNILEKKKYDHKTSKSPKKPTNLTQSTLVHHNKVLQWDGWDSSLSSSSVSETSTEISDIESTVTESTLSEKEVPIRRKDRVKEIVTQHSNSSPQHATQAVTSNQQPHIEPVVEPIVRTQASTPSRPTIPTTNVQFSPLPPSHSSNYSAISHSPQQSPMNTNFNIIQPSKPSTLHSPSALDKSKHSLPERKAPNQLNEAVKTPQPSPGSSNMSPPPVPSLNRPPPSSTPSPISISTPSISQNNSSYNASPQLNNSITNAVVNFNSDTSKSVINSGDSTPKTSARVIEQSNTLKSDDSAMRPIQAVIKTDGKLDQSTMVVAKTNSVEDDEAPVISLSISGKTYTNLEKVEVLIHKTPSVEPQNTSPTSQEQIKIPPASPTTKTPPRKSITKKDTSPSSEVTFSDKIHSFASSFDSISSMSHASSYTSLSTPYLDRFGMEEPPTNVPYSATLEKQFGALNSLKELLHKYDFIKDG